MQVLESRALLSTITQVDDINGAGDLSAGTVARLADQILLRVDDGIRGGELWTTDGTSQGTRLVRDITPGLQSTGMTDFVTFKDDAWFYIRSRQQIWSTDGTFAGTQSRLDLREAELPNFGNSSSLASMIATNNRVYFSIKQNNSRFSSYTLYSFASPHRTKVEGTYADDPLETAATWRSRLFFAASLKSGSRPALWMIANGQTAATRLRTFSSSTNVSEVHTDEARPYVYVSASETTSSGGRSSVSTSVYNYSIHEGQIRRLTEGLRRASDFQTFKNGWVFHAFTNNGPSGVMFTNGTRAGTRLVDDLSSVDAAGARSLTVVGGRYFFISADQLWRGNGVSGATRSIPIPGNAIPSSLRKMGNKLIFTARSAAKGSELYITNGTAAGTILLRDIASGRTSSSNGITGLIGEIGGEFVFVAGDQQRARRLWKTDGTRAGTVAFRTPRQSTLSSNPQHLTSFGDSLVFSATTPLHGREVYFSDGTAVGTRRVTDISPGVSSSSPDQFTPLGDFVYFVAAAPGRGRELWKTDGVSTSLVSHVGTDYDGIIRDLTRVGDHLFFKALDRNRVGFGTTLWISDGTPQGTRPVRNLAPGERFVPDELSVVGKMLYTSIDRGKEHEIWRFNGVNGNAVLVSAGHQSAAHDFIRINGVVLFRTHQSNTGMEIWRTDGTSTGTFELSDIVPGSGSSSPSEFTRYRGKIFFSAAVPGGGRRLWKTDGTLAGTSIVDLGVRTNNPTRLHVGAGRLFIQTGGGGLVSTNGTSNDTIVIAESGFAWHEATTVDNRVYFYNTSTQGQPVNLFKSDGTVAGTTPVSMGLEVKTNGITNEFATSPGHLVAHNGHLFLVLTKLSGDRELFRVG